jgi:hypothetical protein
MRFDLAALGGAGLPVQISDPFRFDLLAVHSDLIFFAL